MNKKFAWFVKHCYYSTNAVSKEDKKMFAWFVKHCYYSTTSQYFGSSSMFAWFVKHCYYSTFNIFLPFNRCLRGLLNIVITQRKL